MKHILFCLSIKKKKKKKKKKIKRRSFASTTISLPRTYLPDFCHSEKGTHATLRRGVHNYIIIQ